MFNKLILFLVLSFIFSFNIKATDDEHLYLKAQQEYESGDIDEALWSKSVTLTGGDKEKAKYKYISLRVEKLMEKENLEKKKDPSSTTINNPDNIDNFKFITNNSFFDRKNRRWITSFTHIHEDSIFASNSNCTDFSGPGFFSKKSRDDDFLFVLILENLNSAIKSNKNDKALSFKQWQGFQCKGDHWYNYRYRGYMFFYSEPFAEGNHIEWGLMGEDGTIHSDPFQSSSTSHSIDGNKDGLLTAQQKASSRKIRDHICSISREKIIDRTGKYKEGYTCPNDFGRKVDILKYF